MHQSPSDVLCEPKKSVELTCRHKINNYDTILWYQRSYGDSSLKLIGYARYRSIKEFEESYKNHFNLTGNGEDEVTLKILQARPDQDSAEYFCAASYAQCHKSAFFHDKNFYVQYIMVHLHETTFASFRKDNWKQKAKMVRRENIKCANSFKLII